MALSIDDPRLIESFRAGENDAFEALVRAHRPALYRHALRKLSDHAAAEDAVQETFMRAYKSRTRVNDDWQLRPWLHQICANVCIDEANRRRKEAHKTSRWAIVDMPTRGIAPELEKELGLDADHVIKQAQTPDFGAVANYASHFDAGRFGQMLREHACQKLGVHHVVDHVDAVLCHENADIAALKTREHGPLGAELFVDCSGLASRLIGQHFQVPLKSEREVLFNDAALPVQVPYARSDAPLATCTIATAWAKGWIWDIGLPMRRGVGCVFSRAHASEEEARDALQAYLNATGAPAERPTPRLIRFDPGYRQQFWVRNCVAIGLSSGFIEPLEASALALVELSVQRLCDELPMTRDTMDAVARRFNEDFTYRWARVIDFLKLHYALTRRDDSDYWRSHRDPATWPERLRELLPIWRLRPPARHDFGRIDEVFPAASYHYVLYGMGFRPDATPLSAAKLQEAQACFDEAARQARRFITGLPGHRSLVDYIHKTAP